MLKIMLPTHEILRLSHKIIRETSIDCSGKKNIPGRDPRASRSQAQHYTTAPNSHMTTATFKIFRVIFAEFQRSRNRPHPPVQQVMPQLSVDTLNDLVFLPPIINRLPGQVAKTL